MEVRDETKFLNIHIDNNLYTNNIALAFLVH